MENSRRFLGVCCASPRLFEDLHGIPLGLFSLKSRFSAILHVKVHEKLALQVVEFLRLGQSIAVTGQIRGGFLVAREICPTGETPSEPGRDESSLAERVGNTAFPRIFKKEPLGHP